MLDLIDKINGLLGTAILPSYRDPRPGDVRHSQADISRTVTELGYCPNTEIDQGLQHCVEYLRDGVHRGSRSLVA